LTHRPRASAQSVCRALEALVRTHDLPPKILIVHQFRLDMLPDKARIRRSPAVRLC